MLHQVFTFNPFAENTYILSDESKHCVIIDPGCSNKEEENILKDYIQSNQLIPEKILLTHGHIDHILGLNFCVNEWKLPIYIHPLDRSTMEYSVMWGKSMGLDAQLPDATYCDIDVNEKMTFGETIMDVLFLPGHAPGHVGFYHQPSQKIFQGDVLFRMSMGRYDLPGADYNALVNSIQNVLYHLPDTCKVYSGHGDYTTIGFEKQNNPFVRP